MKIDKKTVKKISIIMISLVVIGLAIYLVYKLLKGRSKNTSWQVDYLNKVYPLANGKITEDGPIFFDDLEFIFTILLPDDVLQEYKQTSYKAQVPGPSCQQRPCKCITNSDGEKVPNVRFDPDPIWDGQWPPCIFGNYWNAYGQSGLFNWNNSAISTAVAGPCCRSVEDAQKCISTMGSIDKTDPKCESNVCTQLGGQRWISYDVWGGNNNSKLVDPPHVGQWWKPTLHPEYIAVKSKFDYKDISGFYNIKGDHENKWLEVIHTFFPSEESGGDGGAWFYRAVGSGIFLNMGNTFAGINKFDVFVKLSGSELSSDKKSIVFNENAGLEAVVDYLLSIDPDSNQAVMDTITYWTGNLVNQVVSFPFWQWYVEKVPGKTTRDKLKSFVKGIYDPKTLIPNPRTDEDFIFLYNVNRIANTGGIDTQIISAFKQYQKLHSAAGQSPQVARTIQFTAQSNIYPGWTTEILYLGDDYPNNAISNIKDIPKNQLRVLNPLDIPSNGSESSTSGSACNFKYPMRFGYCDVLKDTWLNPKMEATDDVTTTEYSECSDFP